MSRSWRAVACIASELVVHLAGSGKVDGMVSIQQKNTCLTSFEGKKHPSTSTDKVCVTASLLTGEGDAQLNSVLRKIEGYLGRGECS